jgi:UDP:flavonoid glycosyltransferase YjiC (YdhE family)
MAEVLIVTVDAGGNVPPALETGAELQRRGHTVRVLGHPQQQAVVASRGLGFTAYRHCRPWDSTAANGLRDFVGLCTEPAAGTDLQEALPGADLVLVDCLRFGALPAALAGDVPVAVLMHTFHRYWTANMARGPLGLVGALRGAPPAKLWNRADLVLVGADRELDPADKVAANVVHVGPIEPQPEMPFARSAPHLLVSLSTTKFPAMPAALQRIVDAVGELGVPATVTTGPAVDPASVRAASNVRVLGTAPHLELMPTATLMVGHGGHSTTMRALAHDLPLLILPMHPMLDQKMVGAAVARAGAGRQLPTKASSDRIASTLQEMLANHSYADAAARVGARLRTSGGAARAADQLERLLAAR